jgi:hypothetical protein
MAYAMDLPFQSPALLHQNLDNYCSSTISNQTGKLFSFQNTNAELIHHTASTLVASGKFQPYSNNINPNAFASVMYNPIPTISIFRLVPT